MQFQLCESNDQIISTENELGFIFDDMIQPVRTNADEIHISENYIEENCDLAQLMESWNMHRYISNLKRKCEQNNFITFHKQYLMLPIIIYNKQNNP